MGAVGDDRVGVPDVRVESGGGVRAQVQRGQHDLLWLLPAQKAARRGPIHTYSGTSAGEPRRLKPARGATVQHDPASP